MVRVFARSARHQIGNSDDVFVGIPGTTSAGARLADSLGPAPLTKSTSKAPLVLGLR